MLRVAVGAVPHGAVLARTLYASNGRAVLREGHALTGDVLRRLSSFGIDFVWVKEPALDGIHPVEPLSAVTWQQLRQLLAELALSAGREPSLPMTARRSLLSLVGRMTEELETLAAPPVPYPPGRGTLERWIAFTVNQAVLAGRLALAGPYKQYVRDFVLASLLQDLGLWRRWSASKTAVAGADALAATSPESVCQPLVRAEPPHAEAERHVADTLQWLTGVELGGFVRALIAQHHERLDGTGYPEGLRGSAFHPAAQRMAAAVAYGLVVEGCPHRPSLLPHEAYEWLLAEGDRFWGRSVVRELTEILYPYPVGTLVQVDHQYWGVVVDCAGARRLRPRIRLLPRYSPPDRLSGGARNATSSQPWTAGKPGAPGGDKPAADVPGAELPWPEIDLLAERTRTITAWAAVDDGSDGSNAPGTGGEQR